MRQRMASRSERRVEKRQVMTFLVLVLAVSLVSFALGIMVGRMSSSAPLAEAPSPPPDRVPVVAPAPAPPSQAAVASAAAEELTFFDALPKGERPPMGSGINLPRQPASARDEAPKEEALKEAAPKEDAPKKIAPQPSRDVEAKASAAVQERPPAPPPKAPSPPPKAPEPPPASPSRAGTFTLQVASFQDVADALRLQERLASRGYPAYAEAVELGEKGVWTRVFVGPYQGEQAASEAASRLREEEKITPLVRRK